MKKRIRDMENPSILFWGNLALLFLTIVIAGISLLSTRRILLDNAEKMGEEIANSYAIEEEQNLEIYQALLAVGSQYMEGMIERGMSEEYIESWIDDYLTKLMKVAGPDTIDPYAVVNNQVIAADIKKQEAKIDVTSTPWYQKAVGAEGGIVYTDAYTDAIYGKPVVTIAKECGDTGAVIAFDILSENFRIHLNSQILPKGSAYFLCDSLGNILYEQRESEESGAKRGFDRLLSQIGSGELESVDDYYYDGNGDRMRVYCREEPNGWVSVLLIPDSYLIGQWEVVIKRYIGIFALIIGILIYMLIRQKQITDSRRRINETMQILGNSYYAFYRINLKKDTYEMIKGSDYVSSVLPAKGNYEELLDILGKLVKEDTYEEFVEIFSLRHIKKLVAENVEDFGQDFQKIFEDEWKWVNVHILFSPSLCKNEVVLCFRQVEQEKQRQLRRMTLLEDSLKAAHVSDESQKQFFSSISHDMRTPLNVIIGMSEMAGRNTKDADKVKDYLKKINYSSKQLLGLINRILEMSRLDQGMYLDRKPFNLKEKLKKDLEAFDTQAKREKKDLSFTYHVRNENVCGDETRLDQIINNLVSNALSFTKEGDKITVALNEMYDHEYARYQIVISDTGPGMKRELRDQIDLSRVQEGGSGSQNMEELGLGLMIVRNAVSFMNGQIDVESAPGEGTKVTVTLPFERAIEHKKEEDSRKEEFTLEGRRILLAEDYELNMELATEILEMCNALVTQARNGKEALDIFAASDEFFFDAVLMDMQMPLMDGCEAAAKIRSLNREDAECVPIIAVTANTFAEDISRTVKAGMNAHIAKPIDIRILCTTLMRLFGYKEEQEIQQKE